MSQQVLSAIASLHQDILSMRAELASLRADLSSLPSNTGKEVNVEANSSTKVKKDKKKRVMPVGEDGKPILNKWVIFTNRVRELCKDKGVENLLFCKSLKAAHADNYEGLTDDAIKAARSSWVAPPKEAKPSSGSDTEATTTSSKAKGARKSKKQATDAETVATNVTSSTTTTTTAATAEKKKRGPKAGTKKAKEAAKVELPPTTEDDAATDAEAEEPAESPIVYKGKKYWYNANTGAAYERGEDDVRGAYKGIFNPKDPKTGKPSLDTAAKEPTA